MLEISPSSKNSWTNTFPLLTVYCDSFSSTCLNVGIGCNYSSTTSCCNSSFFTCFDAEIDCNCSSIIGWGLISTSSIYEIIITCDVGFDVEVVVLFLKV